MKTMLLTDELIANIAEKHGRCGDTWYITSNEGVLYLYVKNKEYFLHPIMMNEVIMRHLGYLPKPEPKQQPEPEQPDSEPITLDDMKEQINAYLNTHDMRERNRMFNLCHYPTTAANDLHYEDAIKLFNIIKTKLYGKH